MRKPKWVYKIINLCFFISKWLFSVDKTMDGSLESNSILVLDSQRCAFGNVLYHNCRVKPSNHSKLRGKIWTKDFWLGNQDGLLEYVTLSWTLLHREFFKWSPFCIDCNPWGRVHCNTGFASKSILILIRLLTFLKEGLTLGLQRFTLFIGLSTVIFCFSLLFNVISLYILNLVEWWYKRIWCRS